MAANLTRDLLDGDKGNQAQGSRADKGNAIVQHPQQAAEYGEDHRGDVVDGEPGRHTRRDIFRLAYFLEKSSDSYSKIEKDMVGDIQPGRQDL